METPDCSLSESEREGRAEKLRRTLGPRVREIREAGQRTGLRFEPTAQNRGDLEDFIAFERACCQGLRFEIEEGADALWLRIEGPGSGVFAQLARPPKSSTIELIPVSS